LVLCPVRFSTRPLCFAQILQKEYIKWERLFAGSCRFEFTPIVCKGFFMFLEVFTVQIYIYLYDPHTSYLQPHLCNLIFATSSLQPRLCNLVFATSSLRPHLKNATICTCLSPLSIDLIITTIWSATSPKIHPYTLTTQL